MVSISTNQELIVKDVLLILGLIFNRANLGIEVMHERNAHNFPLDLAAVEAPSTNG
jgi:hypothetical protein